MSVESTPSLYRHHALFWGIVLVLFLLFLWGLQAVLFPFVLGLAVAYLLNPTVNALGDRGLNRSAASVLILGGFVVIVTLLALAIGPVVYKELAQLSDDIPSYAEKAESILAPYIDQIRDYVGKARNGEVDGVAKYAGSAAAASKTILSGVMAGGAAITGFISFLALAPIIAFYMMRDWPQMMNWLKGLYPMTYKETIEELLTKIDQKVAGFVRGQLTVAIVLAIFYALACSLAGLKYGLVIGLIAGVLNIIPMLGSIVGFVLGTSVAYVQSGELMFTGIIAGIFLFGQIVEGNFLTPKLVGESVGLHPLWVFFSLMAGGALLGITGMLIAVPVVAIIGVLIGFAIERYKESSFYLGDANKRPKTAKKSTGKSSKNASGKA